MPTQEFDTIPMPAHWACLLINDDPTGNTQKEIRDCYAYLESKGIAYVMAPDGEPYFSNRYDMHGGDCAGGDLMDYPIAFEQWTETRPTETQP